MELVKIKKVPGCGPSDPSRVCVFAPRLDDSIPAEERIALYAPSAPFQVRVDDRSIIDGLVSGALYELRIERKFGDT